MKTPSDVFNKLQIARAHIEDLKDFRAVTGVCPEPTAVVERVTPRDVFEKSLAVIVSLEHLSKQTKAGSIVVPERPERISPRDIYTVSENIVSALQKIKRRLGVQNHSDASKASMRIAPLHVFRELEQIQCELQLLTESFS